MGIQEITSLIIAFGVIVTIGQNVSSHYRIVKVEKQTDGINEHLVKQTRISSYARGLKKGSNIKKRGNNG